MHPTGFSVCFFSGFLAIFILLSSNNNFHCMCSNIFHMFPDWISKKSNFGPVYYEKFYFLVFHPQINYTPYYIQNVQSIWDPRMFNNSSNFPLIWKINNEWKLEKREILLVIIFKTVPLLRWYLFANKFGLIFDAADHFHAYVRISMISTVIPFLSSIKIHRLFRYIPLLR